MNPHDASLKLSTDFLKNEVNSSSEAVVDEFSFC